MKNTKWFIILGWFTLTYSYQLQDDQQALLYCLTHKKSFIAIVWPIAQGKEEKIISALNKYGHIKYRKNMCLTPAQAFYLLRISHTSVTDMNEHVTWYFPKGTFEKEARIFVVDFDKPSHAFSCKHAVRDLYKKLGYRSMHINDMHYETIELARFLFQPQVIS